MSSIRTGLRGVAAGVAALAVAGGALVAAPLAGAQEAGAVPTGPQHAHGEPKRPQEGAERTFQITNITDFHGHFSRTEDEPGAALLKCQIDEESRGKNSVLTSSGDNVGGTPFNSAIQNDEPTLDILNALGVEVTAVGNHEFDQGYDDLVGRIVPRSDYPILAANVNGRDEELLPATWSTTLGGLRVTFIGTVTDETAQIVDPAGIAGIEFADAASVTREIADEIKAADQADLVVSLIHKGVSDPSAFGENVDIVFAGHTHVVPPIDPSVSPLVLQAGSYSENLAIVEGEVDEAGEVTVTRADVLGPEEIAACGEPDPEIAELVAQAEAAAEVEGQRVVATIEESFYRGTQEGARPGSNRGTESTLNNLIADVAREGITNNTAVTADIGLNNAGGVRADLPAGEITYADAFAVQPFNNDVTYTELTGDQLYRAFEQQWKGPEADRPVLNLGVSNNVDWTYDPAKPLGEKVTNINIDGKPVDREATYTVAASTFLLNGGDGFTALSEGPDLPSTGLIDVQLFIDYLEAHAEDLTPRSGQAGVGVTITDGELRAGSEVELALSSLIYSVDPRATQATVELAGATASAEIDQSLGEPGHGEAGTATVRLTLPADAAGAHVLRVTTDAGTDIGLPVEIAPAEGAAPPTDGPGTEPGATDEPTDDGSGDGQNDGAAGDEPRGDATQPGEGDAARKDGGATGQPAPAPRDGSAQAGAGSGSLASTGVSGVLGVLAFGLALSAAGAAGLVASRRQQEA